MWKNFRVWLFNLVNPPVEEYQIDEAKKLLTTITSRYSIEEQSDIVHKLKQELVAFREQEVDATIKHLVRLEANLSELKKQI
jgi:hypothetical protein